MDLEFKTGRDRRVIIDRARGIVIKVAINQNGLVQNYNEYMFNKKRPDITAAVKYYGGEFLIMELVDTTIPNLKQTEESGRHVYSKEAQERHHKWWAVFTELSKELGDSGDNDQIGMTSDGRVVAYDYGHTESFVNSTCHAISKKNDELLNYKLPKRILKRIYPPAIKGSSTATDNKNSEEYP